MRLRLLIAAVLVAASAPVALAEGKPIQRVYPVADLVIPIPDFVGCDLAVTKPDACSTPCHTAGAPKPEQTCEAELIKLIQKTIAPQSWADAGGLGTIDFYPIGLSLVVCQSPGVHEQIAHLLDHMRKLQDNQITFEIRLCEVPVTAFERIGVDFNAKAPTAPGAAMTPPLYCYEDVTCPQVAQVAQWHAQKSIVVSDREVRCFIESMQADPAARVYSSPKLTTLDGQRGMIELGRTEHYVTDVKEEHVNGQVIWKPVNTEAFLGTKLAVQGCIGPNRKQVAVKVRCAHSWLADPAIPMVPVTPAVAPVYEGGAQGKPVPFTQYIQQPHIEKLCVEKMAVVPDGGTLLVQCGKVTAEGRNEFGPPVLSKIPYVNRLFKNVGYGREEKNLYLLVTPRIIAPREGEEACEPGALSSGCSAVIGTTVNSDAGLKGSVVLNERNFCVVGEYKADGCCKGPFSLAEVAQLSSAGISDDVIINQIMTTGTCYTLDAKAILWLKQHGVSDAVVLQMQGTRPGTAKPAVSGTTSYYIPKTEPTNVEPKSEAAVTILLAISDFLARSCGLIRGEEVLCNVYDSTPRERMMQLLKESEDLRQQNKNQMRWWKNNRTD
jgi:Bacterial type II and III secretion system protein